MLEEKTKRVSELDEMIKTFKEQREIFKQERKKDAEEGRMIIKQLTDDIKSLSRENASLQFKLQE